MSWSGAALPDQTGRTAIVTGANSGLGLETTLALAGAGATVVMACRNASKAGTALATIMKSHPGAKVSIASLDLSSLASVKEFATDFTERHEGLDLLINNAGLMATDPAVTAEGFEQQLGVNHLAHFALTAHLLPLMGVGSRIVGVSSVGHRGSIRPLDGRAFAPEAGKNRWQAYFGSKLANLLFTRELTGRLAGAAPIAVTAHPGFSNTNLAHGGTSLFNRLSAVVVPFSSQSAAMGALGTLRAATDPEVKPGGFYGPRFMMVGQPVLETPSRRARSDEAARTLWAASAERAGVEPSV